MQFDPISPLFPAILAQRRLFPATHAEEEKVLTFIWDVKQPLGEDTKAALRAANILKEVPYTYETLSCNLPERVKEEA